MFVPGKKIDTKILKYQSLQNSTYKKRAETGSCSFILFSFFPLPSSWTLHDFFFPSTFVSDGKFLIQHTGFVPIWKWKENTFALRYTEGHLLKPRQSGKVHLPAARLVARGNCICPFSPNGSLHLSRSDLSNIATFEGARKKKKKRKKKHPVLGCKGCASLVLCLAQPFHRSTDIVKRGQEGSKPAAWHPFDRLPWPRKEQWLQESCKYKTNTSPGKIQAQAWFWSCCRLVFRVLVCFSVTLWFQWACWCFHAGWRRVTQALSPPSEPASPSLSWYSWAQCHWSGGTAQHSTWPPPSWLSGPNFAWSPAAFSPG